MKKIIELVDLKIAKLAFVIWTILNISGIQNFYFATNITSIKFVMIKLLHLAFLYLILDKIYLLYKNRKTQKGKYALIYTLIYLLVTTILVIITWPGTWGWDDIIVLEDVPQYIIKGWQHFFSSLFQIICIQTIPMATGVIITQVVIASLIVGYCISNISILFGKSKKQMIAIQIGVLLISLFPPIIIYILSGFRMGIYSYIELLLISKLLIIYKEKKKLEIKDILHISFLTIIISCWRTEGIYYPFIVLILFFILGKECIRKRIAVITILIIVIVNSLIGKYNKHLIGNNNYSITGTIEGVTSIIRIADESDKKEIEKIDKVIDTKRVLENPNKTGETLYWEGVTKNYSDEEYSNYLKAYVKLAVKYPQIVFNSMWNMFVKACGGLGENHKQTTKNVLSNTLSIYIEGTRPNRRWNNIKSKFKNPINLELRNNVILFLSGINSTQNITIIYNIFWNLFIPITLVLICFIYKLIKRECYMIFLILLVITRVPLVFIASPAPYFMYYLSIYMCSYVLAFVIILEFISNLKKSNNNKKE